MKHRKQKKSAPKPMKWQSAALIAVILLGLVAVAVWQSIESGNNHQTNPTSQSQQAEHTKPQNTTVPSTAGETHPALELPYTLEFGKLTVDTAFLLNGFNPDCGNAWAEDVAAIQITNHSREHLASVTVFVVIRGGVMVEFAASDIPAGGTAMVFSRENVSVKGQIDCMQIACQAVFEEKAPLMEDMVAITVEGTSITVQNLTDRDLSQLTVYCHDMMGEYCYGGSTYQYTIELLPAGETVTLIAEDFEFGQAEVVRVTQGE